MSQSNHKTRNYLIGLATIIVVVGAAYGIAKYVTYDEDRAVARKVTEENDSGERRQFMIAGGCFWCVEHDLEEVPGVTEVVSGYAGGTTENPTYENYAQGGHREVVRVEYDPKQVSEFGLMVYELKHMDPTDGDGSFVDRGPQYAPAIYYKNDAEKQVAEAALEYIKDQKVFDKPLQVPVLPEPKFWPAEEYHQDYAVKSDLEYSYYRNASGRDDFIEDHWGEEKAKAIPERPEPLPELKSE